MRYHKIITLLLCLCLGFPFILSAENNSKLIQVLMLVKKAKHYVLQHGRIQAVSAFNNPKGKFRHGEYYIFAMVCNDGANDGIILSDPATPEHTFQNRLQAKSKLIYHFVHEASETGTWFAYQWIDPINQQHWLKHAYVIRIPSERICLGSGYYESP